MNTLRSTLVAITLGIAMLLWDAPAAAVELPFTWNEGTLRLELSGLGGVRSGRRSRKGDANINGILEYEIPLREWHPAMEHGTVGLRLRPLFYYWEDQTKDSIWGASFGITQRAYPFSKEKIGWFGEFSQEFLWHSDEIRGNTSRVNFILTGGLGYQTKQGWFTTAQFRHISNGGTGRRNSGSNGIGLAIGYRFYR